MQHASIEAYDILYQSLNSSAPIEVPEVIDTSVTLSMSSRSNLLRIEKQKELEKKRELFESLNQQVYEKAQRITKEQRKEVELEERLAKTQLEQQRIVNEEKNKLHEAYHSKMALLDKKIAKTRWLTNRLKLSPLRIKLWEDEKKQTSVTTVLKTEDSDIIGILPELQAEPPIEEDQITLSTEDEELIPPLEIQETVEEEYESTQMEEDIEYLVAEDLESEESIIIQEENIQEFNDEFEEEDSLELPFSAMLELGIGQPILLQYLFSYAYMSKLNVSFNLF
jgi:hypothetical protein